MYRCECCGSRFDTPYTDRYREDMNGEGAWETRIEHKCPYCESEYFDEIEEDDAWC